MVTRYSPALICIYPKDRFPFDPGFDYRARDFRELIWKSLKINGHVYILHILPQTSYSLGATVNVPFLVSLV